MALSSVTGHINQFQNYCLQSLSQVKTKVSERTNWVRQKVTEKWTDTISKQPYKPLYERYIEPLDKIDAYLASGFAIAALSVILIAGVIFGKPLIAASVLIGFTLMLGCWKIIRYRVEKKFNADAYAVFERIIIEFEKPEIDLALVESEIGKLRDSKYEHLKNDLSEIEKKIAEFRRDTNALDPSQAAKFNNFKEAFTNYLKSAMSKFAP